MSDAITGAGYLAAVLGEDTEILDNYRKAFTGDELLEALTVPIHAIGGHLGVLTETTKRQIGDALIKATVLGVQLGIVE